MSVIALVGQLSLQCEQRELTLRARTHRAGDSSNRLTPLPKHSMFRYRRG